MIRSSLIVGTLITLLSRLWTAFCASGVYRVIDRVCAWFGRQLRESRIIRWFCSPRSALRKRKERVRPVLARLYRACRLDRLLTGSIFLQSAAWCIVCAALAPFLPTLASMGLALVGCGSTVLHAAQERERPLKPSPLGVWIVLYVGMYLVGTLTSVDLHGSLYVGLLTALFILFAAALYHAVDTKKQLDLLVTLLVMAGAVESLYGILQYVFRWGYQSAAWVDSAMFSSISFRVGGTMQNPNMLGQYLILMLPLAGARLLSAKERRQRLFYFCCCGVMCLCVLLTFSRGAWLGLLFAGAIFLTILKPRLLLALPFVLLALYLVLPSTITERFLSIGDLGDRSTNYRVMIWKGTLDMLSDGYWITGIGPGEAAFNRVYPRYCYATVVAPHAHNLFLQIVCDAGVAALLIFLLLLLRSFRTQCAALWKGSCGESRLLQVAFLSGTAGFLLQAMTDYSFYNYRVMLLFWVYLSAGMLAARRDELSEGGVLS